MSIVEETEKKYGFEPGKLFAVIFLSDRTLLRVWIFTDYEDPDQIARLLESPGSVRAGKFDQLLGVPGNGEAVELGDDAGTGLVGKQILFVWGEPPEVELAAE